MIIFLLLAILSAYLQAYLACGIFSWAFFYLAFCEVQR